MATVEKSTAIDPVVLADLEAIRDTKGVIRDRQLCRRIKEQADKVWQEKGGLPNLLFPQSAPPILSHGQSIDEQFQVRQDSGVRPMLENYHQDEFGVLHQTTWKPKVYDQQYLSYYQGLQERTIKLGYQRLGWILGLFHRLPNSVFEVGYGMGTFLEAAALAGVPLCAGYDVAHFPLPASCVFVDWEEALARVWDLTVFFDVLEHIPDLSFLGRLRTATLALAVPYCRWSELGDEWFHGWRMRLPDEHLHHFEPHSLRALMAHHGYRCTDMNTFEDGLRLRTGETGPNILCAFFERER